MKADNLRRGPWYEEEDERLKACVSILSERRWDSIARASGLRRSGKSCRLRWLNYLRPCLKQGPLTPEEESLVLELHEKWGNKWANIARKLPGRTDNEIKNYYRTHLRKKMQMQMQNGMSCNSDSFSSEETSSFSDQTNSCKHYQDTSSEEDKTTKEDESIKENNTVLVDDELGTKSEPYTESHCHWTNGVPEYITASSPYEDRLSDWATGLSRDQTDMFSNLCIWECNGLESPFGYSSGWSVGDTSLHDCTDTLWDVDLLNVKCE